MTTWLGRFSELAASRPAPDWPGEVPADGLLCALVLVPSAMPRNRFYPLFARVEAKRARARAAQIRATIRHLVGRSRFAIRLIELTEKEGGIVQLRYRLPEIKLDRSVWLDRLELSVLRLAIERISPSLTRNRRGLSACSSATDEGAWQLPSPDHSAAGSDQAGIVPACSDDRDDDPNDDRLGVLSDPRLSADEEDRRRVDSALLQLWNVLGATLTTPPRDGQEPNESGGG